MGSFVKNDDFENEEENLALLMDQSSRWMTLRILKIGRPLIPYWCLGFETPLNHLFAQRSHMSKIAQDL